MPKSSFNLWSTYKLPIPLTLGGGSQFTNGYFFNNTNARYVDRGYTGHFVPGAGRAVLGGPVFSF